MRCLYRLAQVCILVRISFSKQLVHFFTFPTCKPPFIHSTNEAEVNTSLGEFPPRGAKSLSPAELINSLAPLTPAKRPTIYHNAGRPDSEYKLFDHTSPGTISTML